MLRRLRHRAFGHGQDGHTFLGYQTAWIYLLCRCGESLHFHVSNFISFEATPPKKVVSARKVDELHRHGTT